MAQAANATTTNRRLFLVGAAALPVLAIPAIAAEPDPLTKLDAVQLSAVFDAHKAAADAITGIYNQPRIFEAEPLIFAETQPHLGAMERIAKIAEALTPTTSSEAHARLNLLRVWSAEVDDPALDRRIAAELIAYAGDRTI